jgi:hypothetical protein
LVLEIAGLYHLSCPHFQYFKMISENGKCKSSPRLCLDPLSNTLCYESQDKNDKDSSHIDWIKDGKMNT